MTDETKAIIIDPGLRLGVLNATGPAQIIQQATAVAKELAGIINGQKLYTVISGRKYVRVEGWSTMGAMLGVLPREDSVVRLDDGGYEAIVSLIRTSDGAVIGRASAICGMDEKTWASRAEYARGSMSITRATGKAFRLGFSWIITLAGYEATPAEEMASETIDAHFMEEPITTASDTPEPSPENGKKKGSPVPATLQALIDNKIADSVPNAAAIINLSPFRKGEVNINELVAWGKLYRAWRDAGTDTKAAAENATAGAAPE